MEMNSITAVKNVILGAAAAIGSAIAYLLGGFDTAMQTLVIFMVLDYACGLMVAGVFMKSLKTASGALDSRIGFKGIMKKVVIILAVIAGEFLDKIMGDSGYTRTAIILFFIANEGLSIIENLALMGVPFPDKVKVILEQLKDKNDTENTNTDE